MILGERIINRLEVLSLSQSALARRVGVSQQTIGKLIHGAARGSSHIAKIARELQTTPAYLLGETDDPSEGALPIPTPELIAEQLDLVSVSQVDLQYGMGGTFTDLPVEQEVLHFPRVWLESITRTPPASLTFARGRGDSMVPTLHDGDMILIDHSQRTVREQDAIWAITVGDVGMIRRVRVKTTGSVTILSDNPSVPPDEADVEEINVVGRVVFIGRKV